MPAGTFHHSLMKHFRPVGGACFRPWQVGIGLCVLAGFLPACHPRHDSRPDTKSTEKHSKEVKVVSHSSSKSEAEQLSRQIESFTGAHTRMVWNECQNAKVADPMSGTEDQMLRGIDTADGLGERPILAEKGNYSRPLISPDGKTILYTRKIIRPHGHKHLFDLTIFRTDWKGTSPMKLAEGYAVDMWRDPQTARDWVIAVRDPEPSRQQTFDVGKLIRFPLDAPEKTEVLWDQTPLSPDNIQLSRDGLHACALLPWPAGGVIQFGKGAAIAHEFSHGCWPSQSPDNSYVSWVFNGDHKSASFFNEDGSRSWEVRFNTVPEFKRGEVYHPRWSNHPRYFVLTGPYRGINSGGGRGANVHLCKLSEKLDKLEEVLQVVDNKYSQGFPAAWIEGAEKVETPGFHSSSAKVFVAKSSADDWPVNPAGLVFLWKDRPSLNSFKGSDGRTHTSQVETEGLAHCGRFQEAVLDGGTLRATDETLAYVTAGLAQHREASFEAVVIPSVADAGSPVPGRLLDSPGFSVGVLNGKLVVTRNGGVWESEVPLPVKPYHLVVTGSESGAAGWIDGSALALKASSSKVPAPSTAVSFGEDWNGGLLRLAIYDRTLTAQEVAADASFARSLIDRFSAPPPRVILTGKLVEASSVPTPESIAPYRSSLVSCVYEVQKITSGSLSTSRVLLKHWGLLNLKQTAEFPREIGRTYELTIERESDHPELKGERVSDDTAAFDLEPWLDVSRPSSRK